MRNKSTTVPYGFCHCGCGNKTPIATYNHGPRGMVKGEPLRYIRFHHGRRRRPAYQSPDNPEQGIVPLTHGRIAVIDAEDIERVSRYTWRAAEDKNTFYAVTLRQVAGSDRREKLSLHRFVLGVKDPSVKVDHIDGDGLNNAKSNLRLATNQQNAMNMRARAEAECPYKGVSKYKHYQKWTASIRVDGKQRHIGYFDSPEEAARAYDHAARESFGEYAALNFPNPGEQSALLVKRNGEVRATIAIEIPEVREVRERKKGRAA